MASTVWKGQLTFGLVSLPVRLVRAARRERVRMHYVAASSETRETAQEENPPGERRRFPLQVVQEPWEETPVVRIKQSVMKADDETPLDRRDLLKGHEVAPDQYVTFTRQELQALRPETSPEIQIVRSVRLEEIDPVYFETSYYVLADRGGERPYALLFGALKESGYVALATMAMHGREHVVVIRPGRKGLLAHTIFYIDEIRAENEFEATPGDLGAKEIQLARTFVETIAGPFAPEEFKDMQREKLQELIADKVARDAVSPVAGTLKPITAPADIMEALRKSLNEIPKRGPGKVAAHERRPHKRKA